MNVRVVFYDAEDGWRWRFIGDNGEPLGSGEAYQRRIDAVNALRVILGARRLAAMITVGRVRGLVP